MEDKLVGVNAMEVIDLLIRPGEKLKIMSIVGMPGLGKTKLANSVFNHASMNMHFDIWAWCFASQTCKKESLLSEILSQVGGSSRGSQPDCDVDLEQEVFRSLKGRKYLIVIDDVWDAELWRNLENIIPDDRKGSRILFTTRDYKVAWEANSLAYPLRLLSSEESYELLVSKVLNVGEACSRGMRAILECVAGTCNGLPLAIVLIAGILKKTERKRDSWKLVSETVMDLYHEHGKSSGLDGMVHLTHVLSLSYKHLPDFLKPCFLYFGAVPKVSAIPVSMLIRLWISEGFVGLEERGREYLNELVDRSLVMVDRTSSQNGAKTCRIHDVLRDFCSRMLWEHMFLSREEKFGGILYLRGNLEEETQSCLYQYTSDAPKSEESFEWEPFSSYDTSREVHQGTSLLEAVEKSTYSKLHFPQGYFKASTCSTVPLPRAVLGSGPFLSAIRGEAVFTMPPTMRTQVSLPSRELDYSFVLKYKQLGVLDLGNVRFESGADSSHFVMIATMLVDLTYLAIRLRGNEIPTEISNLQKLQTLVLKGVIGSIFFPETFGELLSLRYLLTDHGLFTFKHCSQQFFDNFPRMVNMKSISNLVLRPGSNVDKYMLKMLPGLQKLGCRLVANLWTSLIRFSFFPQLDFLSELKSLKIFFSCQVPSLCRFGFPSNLTKLCLSNSRLPWDQLSVTAQLMPNLEVLKLLSKAFQGEKWDTGACEDHFAKLKFLKLESLDIMRWDLDDADHFPSLEQLVVLHCEQLQEIPSAIGEIPTLKLIEMKWCSPSASASATQILQLQRDFSNLDLNLTLSSEEADTEEFDTLTEKIIDSW